MSDCLPIFPVVPIMPQTMTVGPYQPSAESVELYPETGDAATTLMNLKCLMETPVRGQRRTIVRMCNCGRTGNVAVIFDTCEVYAAIDFAGTDEFQEFQREYYPLSLEMEDAIFSQD